MNELELPEEIKKEVVTIEELTKTVAVRNTDERALVFAAVQSVKIKKKSIVDFFKDMKEKAFQAHRAISQAEKKETDKLDAFEAAGKRAILAYDQAEEAKRIAEQRRLQAIADEQARKDREKAEAEARRQRQIEEEARAKAEAARRAAEQANAEERARLLKEAEAAERKAAAAQVKADTKDEDAALVVAPVVQVAPVTQKIKGESTKSVWRIRVTDFSKLPDEYKVPNEKALNAVAQATKGAISIPGTEIYEEKTLSIRMAA